MYVQTICAICITQGWWKSQMQTNAGVPDRTTENVNFPNSEKSVHNQNQNQTCQLWFIRLNCKMIHWNLQAKSQSLHESDARSQVRAIMNFSAATLETLVLCNPKFLHTLHMHTYI